MHYGGSTFSKNRRRTIIAKGNPKRPIGGQGSEFTQIDKNQLNKLYKCKGTCGGTGIVTPGGKKPNPGTVACVQNQTFTKEESGALCRFESARKQDTVSLRAVSTHG